MTLTEHLHSLGWQDGLEPSDGLLAPDGTFWMCEYGTHRLLAGDIVDYLGPEYDKQVWISIGYIAEYDMTCVEPSVRVQSWYIEEPPNGQYTPGQAATLRRLASLEDEHGMGAWLRSLGY